MVVKSSRSTSSIVRMGKPNPPPRVSLKFNDTQKRNSKRLDAIFPYFECPAVPSLLSGFIVMATWQYRVLVWTGTTENTWRRHSQ